MKRYDFHKNHNNDLIPVLHNIRFHSYYDLESEAKEIFDCYYNNKISNYTFIGLGFGYHLRFFLNKNINITIIILNPELFELGEKNSGAEIFKKFKYVNLLYIDKLTIIEMNRILNDSKRINIYHTPSIEATKECEKKDLIKTRKVKDNTSYRFREIMEKNISVNSKRNYKKIDEIMDKIKLQNVIITGAGPSLDLDVHMIKNIRENVFILASGTSLKVLITHEIVPDAVIITDPQVKVTEQIKDININVPLIILRSSNHYVQNFWKGEILLCSNKINSGGSVVTTAFDIAVKSHAKSIILSGVDFSYPNNYSHARDAHRSNKVNEDELKYKLLNYEGKYSKSAYNLIIYKKWIEKEAKKTNINVYNITSKGAVIRDTIRLTEEELLRNF